MEMLFHKIVSQHKRKISAVLLTVMISELLLPLRALALTSGPSQPEFQGFTPLATTSLVDPFSGDFSYNIPLLDIEGYPLNLVYRATSNIEEEGSWVGYGWNINVGTLNRHVRGLPDDMNGGMIKSYQNIRERKVKSTGVSMEPNFGVHVGSDGIGATAGFQNRFGFTYDDDNYIGVGIGLSVGAGVYANVNAGPFSVGGSAGVTTAAHSNLGGTLSVYAGYNVGISYGDYFAIGFGKSVNRSFNTISGWEKPNVVGSFNICNVTMEIQKNFVSSISNEIPQITNGYKYSTDGWGFNLDMGLSFGIVEELGIDLGLGVMVTQNTATTTYDSSLTRRGFGYMYAENATALDILDFTRDNDGAINREMPYMPPAMKTFDVFSSTAHNGSGVFRADRNDFGTVRDPLVIFQNSDQKNEMHEVELKVHVSFNCLGATLGYNNVRTRTVGTVMAGGCNGDLLPYRKSTGRDQNLFFKVCGTTSQADDNYLGQVNGYGYYSYNKTHTIKGGTVPKRAVNAEPIAVYSNKLINDLPQTVLPKQLVSYEMNEFPSNKTNITTLINRPSSNLVDQSKIGAVLNTNKAGQTYLYATPVENNIKNEVAFRVDGFNTNNFQERDGLMTFDGKDATQYNGRVRDKLYKTKITPSYATSYLLNAVLSPDYVDVSNDGLSDDDMGSYVRFNYTKTANDYRWRVPYADSGQNLAFLNQGIKVTKFDDMGSYMIGSKQIWYAHSIESKNYVAEFYLSKREDALDSRSRIMLPDHPHAVSAYTNNKDSFAHLYKLDSIRYFYKHDRFINQSNAVPLKTIYFTYDYGISSNVPNSLQGGKLRLTKVRVRHGNEPLAFAETYNLGYVNTNPAYHLGEKDGWGNYAPNERPHPMCEFPYIDQINRQHKDSIACAFHLNAIALPSGGKIDVDYEADDYTYVQNRRAMALTEVAGVGRSANLVNSDVFGLYDNSLNPHSYIYVKKPAGAAINKGFLLNNSDLMYFSFNIKIAGSKFPSFDQVKGYAEVEDIGTCPNDGNYMYIKVKPVSLTKTNVKPSPMTNTAINMARAFATDQLYYQEDERPNGKNKNRAARILKAAVQIGESILGRNAIQELMKNNYRAGRDFNRNKSYVRLAVGQPKIGGGSRVAKLTFDDEWNKMTSGESSSLVGYNYQYVDGVASYEPTIGGEENPLRSGSSYRLSNNRSNYPPFDPIEMLKEDPAGESFFPVGSVGYSKVIIESIHKGYARSAQTRLVHKFYTAKDFPFFSSYGPIVPVVDEKDETKFNPGIRDILLSFLGKIETITSSKNVYVTTQDFVIETNDMHGKPKGTYNYRLLLKNGKEELVSFTEYHYHTNGNSRLSNEVDVIQHQSTQGGLSHCLSLEKDFPKGNVAVVRKTLGVDIDVCTDSREVASTEDRKYQKRGGSLKICLPPSIKPKFNWQDKSHKHFDYFKSTITTKVINRYGILKSVRNYKEGAETFVYNKYYDAVTGSPVVQVYKDEYADNIYSTNVPAYWTRTDLEPSYFDYPFFGTGAHKILPDTLHFTQTGAGLLSGSNLIQASFTTYDDIFHPGDEIFVYAGATVNPVKKWHRLYVADVLVKKNHFGPADPLQMRFGNGGTSGAQFQVFVTPHKVSNFGPGDLGVNDKLYDIESMSKYRSGRKNMLDLSAGTYLSLRDPFVNNDTIHISHFQERACDAPNFLIPVIDAKASRYDGLNSVPGGSLNNLFFNPVSAGVINQPYVSATYSLFGDRKDQSTTMKQRGNGVLFNWYYWLPNRYDSTTNFVPLRAFFANYNSSLFSNKAANNNAKWFNASRVTKSIPSLGPVEETNPLGIYSSIFLQPVTRKLSHATSNGKFGQTWVETFEDLQQLKKYNGATDLVFSPFQKHMTKTSTLDTAYKVFNTTQSLNVTDLTGSFTLDKTLSHTGLFCLNVSSTTTVKTMPKKHTGTASYFFNLFDFNLDDTTNQKYTYEVWVKKNSGTITAPSITTNGSTTSLTAVSMAIDGWVLYRTNLNVSDNTQVTFTFPGGQYYDDLRVFPMAANVKTYVYHPFKTYLMAILDENNYATFYEYNTRNQLIRLKKETEKGVITVTENIKNIVIK